MRGAVCIGAAVHAETACLATTVAFLRAYTDSGVRLVLLPDGPDEPTASALITDPELAAIEQWATPDPRGMAACFNRLATRSQADVVVLLESGAFVGPRWLELLLAALDQPGCGLVGPSTNVSWNEQGIEPHARGDEEGVRRAAATALRRFGTAARTLEPLYSLADFCYAVSRPVIDAIGPAEEAYGVGPCWEMDYNIQAARAGFRGVWVGASYVYRSAPPRPRLPPRRRSGLPPVWQSRPVSRSPEPRPGHRWSAASCPPAGAPSTPGRRCGTSSARTTRTRSSSSSRTARPSSAPTRPTIHVSG